MHAEGLEQHFAPDVRSTSITCRTLVGARTSVPCQERLSDNGKSNRYSNQLLDKRTIGAHGRPEERIPGSRP